MNTNPSPIEQVVMRRVARIRILRNVFSGTTFALVVSTVTLWDIGREVWVARIFENAPEKLFDLVQFAAFAFGHTRFIVQALSVVLIVSVIYLAREAARLLASLIVPARN